MGRERTRSSSTVLPFSHPPPLFSLAGEVAGPIRGAEDSSLHIKGGTAILWASHYDMLCHLVLGQEAELVKALPQNDDTEIQGAAHFQAQAQEGGAECVSGDAQSIGFYCISLIGLPYSVLQYDKYAVHVLYSIKHGASLCKRVPIKFAHALQRL